jgi:hypothetical protein
MGGWLMDHRAGGSHATLDWGEAPRLSITLSSVGDSDASLPCRRAAHASLNREVSPSMESSWLGPVAPLPPHGNPGRVMTPFARHKRPLRLRLECSDPSSLNSMVVWLVGRYLVAFLFPLGFDPFPIFLSFTSRSRGR